MKLSKRDTQRLQDAINMQNQQLTNTLIRSDATGKLTRALNENNLFLVQEQ